MRAEDLKGWLAAARQGEKEREAAVKDGGSRKDNREGAENWARVVELIQTEFQEGELSEENTWQAVVLIPKGEKYYRGIGLVEVMWKVVAVILNRCFTYSITYHNALHGFRADRGMGTSTLEAKLLQQLAAIREEVLYVIFLDLTKVYDALDTSRCLEILESYGVGPGAMRLLTTYRRRLTMVAREGGHYGKYFKGDRGVTQGDPLSTTILNVVVDAVVRHWVNGLVNEAEGKGETGREGRHQSVVFYAENSMVVSSDPAWLQGAFSALVAIFDRVVLVTNVGKTVSMVCHPCWAGSGNRTKEAYSRRLTGWENLMRRGNDREWRTRRVGR